MNKYLFILLICFLSAGAWSATETNLKIKRVGSWAEGNSTFYLKLDRVVGPEECRSDLLKIDLGKESDIQEELMAKNMIRSMALAAFAGDYNVELSVPDNCLYNNPTITQMWVYK